MKVNPFNDQVAMYMLSIGVIEVDKEGKIWRLRSRKSGRYHKWVNIIPKRVDIKQLIGYRQVWLSICGKTYHIFAHRIAWISKNGIIPEGLELNHKNGIKDDNRLENLELVTRSNNLKHSYQMLGRQPIMNKGEKHGMAILTEQDVREIRERYNDGNITQADLGKNYNVSRPHISDIVNRKKWKHI